jgi:hypothetical protein
MDGPEEFRDFPYTCPLSANAIASGFVFSHIFHIFSGHEQIAERPARNLQPFVVLADKPLR